MSNKFVRIASKVVAVLWAFLFVTSVFTVLVGEVSREAFNQGNNFLEAYGEERMDDSVFDGMGILWIISIINAILFGIGSFALFTNQPWAYISTPIVSIVVIFDAIYSLFQYGIEAASISRLIFGFLYITVGFLLYKFKDAPQIEAPKMQNLPS